VVAVHTPGHTPDHVVFFVPTLGALFTGDAVLGRGTSVIDPPEGDLAAYLRSLDAMAALAPRTIYPGHGPAVWAAAEKLAEYRAHREERERQVLDALAEGACTPEDIVATVYADYPPEVHALGARSVLAHLLKLEREGRAAHVGPPRDNRFEPATPAACRRCGRPAIPRSTLWRPLQHRAASGGSFLGRESRRQDVTARGSGHGAAGHQRTHRPVRALPGRAGQPGQSFLADPEPQADAPVRESASTARGRPPRARPAGDPRRTARPRRRVAARRRGRGAGGGRPASARRPRRWRGPWPARRARRGRPTTGTARIDAERRRVVAAPHVPGPSRLSVITRPDGMPVETDRRPWATSNSASRGSNAVAGSRPRPVHASPVRASARTRPGTPARLLEGERGCGHDHGLYSPSTPR
jgi:hypothetical protein